MTTGKKLIPHRSKEPRLVPQSLKPLKFEDALRAALMTGPPPDMKRSFAQVGSAPPAPMPKPTKRKKRRRTNK